MNFFDKYSWQFQLTVACIVALLGLTACISEKDSNSTEQENEKCLGQMKAKPKL